MPVTVFYWDKKTSNKLTIYESNFADTYYIPLVNGNYLYRIGRPDGSEITCLEKMDMRTGQSEWLWKEKTGPGSMVRDCWEYNNHIYLSTAKNDGTYPEEIYTKDGFQQVTLPFLKEWDSILFEDEYGYVVWKTIEHRENSANGDIVDFIFIPIEEAGKENPEYTVLRSGERN